MYGFELSIWGSEFYDDAERHTQHDTTHDDDDAERHTHNAT